jgi:hypothetical protein
VHTHHEELVRKALHPYRLGTQNPGTDRHREASVGLLAEQIFIRCEPSRLEALFCHRPATWMVPLLRLAGDEGEADGLAVLGLHLGAGGTKPRRSPGHAVDVQEPGRVDGRFRVALHWATTGYQVLFGAFDGTLEVRAREGHSVVRVEGLFGERAGPPDMTALATRRAAESAVRSLLGHLRSAVEESASFPR